MVDGPSRAAAVRECSSAKRRPRWRRAIPVALALVASLAIGASSAHAAAGLSVAISMPSPTTVGTNNLSGTLTMTNQNTPDDVAMTICNAGDGGTCAGSQGITLMPSCGAQDFTSACTAAGADPDVFFVNAGAVGAVGTSCANTPFAVSTVDATFGKVRFTPDAGAHVVLPGTGSICRINFTFNVLTVPTKDARPAAGIQTIPIAEVLGVSDLDGTDIDRGSMPGVTVMNPPPAAPTLTGSDPDSPADANSPAIKGSAPAGTTVRLYTSASCTGTVVAQGSATDLASPGFTVSVGDDTTTTFHATATDASSSVSACSSSGLTYVEDSTAPAAPSLTSSDPSSPANDNTPNIKGSAGTGTTVRLFTNPLCAGSAVGSGSASQFESTGISVAVFDDSSTTFHATATDAAGNVSACSATGLTYVEDSTAPSAPGSATAEPQSPANNNAPRISGSAPAGTTVRLYANAACSGDAAASGTAAAFASPGLPVTVADNSSTTIYGTTTDTAGNVSGCVTLLTYVEDSIAPSPPSAGMSNPASPANSNSPRIKGTAPADTTVRLYTNAACSGVATAQGSAGAFGSPGLAAAVADDPVTTFYGTATSIAGNVSPCSPALVTYVEDSTAPETTIDEGPTGATTVTTPTFAFSSPDPSATFGCRVDFNAFAPCASPFTTVALTIGSHTFEVRAIDAAGNADPTSAGRSFFIGTTTPPDTRTQPPNAQPPQTGCTLRGSVVVGTAGKDTLAGASGSDVLHGMAGNDILRGFGGRDCLYGGLGIDQLNGGAGGDFLWGAAGGDRLLGAAGSDLLSGGAGNDRLDGATGIDRLVGGAGNDRLTDKAGQDRFSGGAGKDRIDSRDRRPADKRKLDRILCGAGKDTVLADRRDNAARDCEKVIKR
jgi:Ca2+-binding RTX toxin-like protein